MQVCRPAQSTISSNSGITKTKTLGDTRMTASEEKKSEVGWGVAHRLARPNILELLPYRCARDDYSSGILLDANENAYGPASLPTNLLDPYDNHNTLERYPDPYQIELKTYFSKYRGYDLNPSNVFVGVGSDEAIDLLMRIFCAPQKDNILITSPTYGMYKVCAKVNDIPIIDVPLTKDFKLRVPEILSSVTNNTKLLFICSPGNPTASAISLDQIEAIASSSQYNGIVVVDEAYVDFSKKGTGISLIHKYPNIVVLQTLSKAFGLAGIRCGFCVGSPDVIQLMNNVKAPYNVNALTSEVAINAFKTKGAQVLNSNVNKILEQRDIVMGKLNELDFVTEVFPSDSNFILFRVKELAKELYVAMAEGKSSVVTRYRGSEIHCENCIRATVGTKEENEAFFEALTKTWDILQQQKVDK